jgi:electron transfer flavoprotein beta subunit
MPALCTIQTGINEPRYASLIAIRRAAKKEIKAFGKSDVSTEEILQNSTLEELFTPPVGKRAEILTGSVDEISTQLTGIMKEKGIL